MGFARAFLLFSLCSVPLFAPTGVTGSVREMRWFSTESVKIDKTIGRGSMADVVPIHGEGIAENRVVKLYRWDLNELGPRPEGANLSDSVVLSLLNGYERVRAVLGDEAIAVDGAINWNNGNKGVILERLPEDAELFDVKEGLAASKYATPTTIERFKAAMAKLVTAGIYHHDIHVAILPDGRLKFYDNDLARPMDGREQRLLEMKEVTRKGVDDLAGAISRRVDCAHFGGVAAPHFLRKTKEGSRRRLSQ